MPLLPVSDLEKWIPAFRGKAGRALAESLRGLLGIRTLSGLYDEICGSEGADFARTLLQRLNVRYRIGHPDRLAQLPEGPFVTVSNHPYGGLDGVMLIDLMGHLRDDFKVMANEFLTVVKALTPSLIVVNPSNKASTGVTERNIRGTHEVFRQLSSGHPVGFFPSGAVSDLHLRGQCAIRDRDWQMSTVRLIKKARVPVVPVRFFDRNSLFFYLLGLVDWRVRVTRLPRELLNKRDATPRIGIGEVLSVEAQDRLTDLQAYRSLLRGSVYDMPLPDSFTEL
jgi:putative hemolysin